MSPPLNDIAVSDATKGKGGKAETSAAQIQELTMLNLVEAGRDNNLFPASSSAEMDAAKWLDDQVRLSQTGITCTVVEITPHMARALLARNPDNRKVSETTVSNIVRDINAGNFVVNGESIIVSNDGSLNDGQHRLCACIEAETAITSVVVFGPKRETRVTVDQGRNKMVGDYLAMEGHKDGNALAAAAAYILQWQSRNRLSSHMFERPTKGEVMAMVNSDPSVAKSVDAIGGNGVAGRGLLAFCHWVFTNHSSRVAADRFVMSLISGANLLSNDPILYARNRLMAERRLKPNEKAKLIFRAWNAHRRGESPKSLLVNERDSTLPMVER